MKLIDGWRVLGLLGRGGMGTVYKVARPEGGRLWALKLLTPREPLPALLGLEEITRRFQREADILAGLSHPNLVTVRARGEHQGRPYYLMEYLCNNLGDLIGEDYQAGEPGRALDPELVLDYGRQTLMALGALHDAEVVHRDLKPHNLMLDDQGAVKLADLGLSKLRGEHRPGPPNLLVGSPYYAAPEQESDPESASARSDLYSLGVTLYRLAGGRLYSPGDPPLSRLTPELDPSWDRLVMPLLEQDPDRRPKGAGQALEQLEETDQAWHALGEQVCRRIPPPPAPPAGPSRLRSQPRKVPPQAARRVFGLDPLWRPLAYQQGWRAGSDPELVLHPATGLAWQRAGWPGALPWAQANQALDRLNAERPAGGPAWRLPTVDELLTILSPPPHLGDLCAPPIFDPAQVRLWSADRASFTSAWYVSLRVGFVGRQDFTCFNHLRAVRRMTQGDLA
jgi:serine/threonine-protein kinase